MLNNVELYLTLLNSNYLQIINIINAYYYKTDEHCECWTKSLESIECNPTNLFVLLFSCLS